MKKKLKIVVLCLFMFNVAFSATSIEVKKNIEDSAESITKEQITDDWIKDKKVSDLVKLDFIRGATTTTEDSIQYHLSKTFIYDPYADSDAPAENFSNGYVPSDQDIVFVICFITKQITNCRLP